ncbi:MAG: decarboxylase, partial [Peptococcaceae bacterium]|nr:decarboxylase [Peptococcaceae bacterium]
MISADQAPLFAAMTEHVRRSLYNFHMPGHKGGRGLPPELTGLAPEDLYAMDLTELPGLDDLHRPQGVIAHAQELAAAVYGAAQSFFLVNGSTVGIQALLLALCGDGGKVIVPRHCHRSVLSGLILSGAEPVYLAPLMSERFGFALGVSSQQITDALTQHPDVSAVLTVRPSYYGTADNLAGQVQATHQAGKPLLVDEAHGANLRFHPQLPKDAMTCGADASVQSAHKMSVALTQSAMLHVGKGFQHTQRVAAALSLLQTTSPSYLLLASLDLARHQMTKHGTRGLENALELTRETRCKLAKIRGLSVLTGEHLPTGWSLDETKLVVAVDSLGLTGYQVMALLAERYGINIEMADSVNIVAFLSSVTTAKECNTLVAAMEDISNRERLPWQLVGQGLPQTEMPKPVLRLKPREAWFAAAENVLLAESGGRICTESVAVYPPGVPIVCPGEEITP